MKQISKEKLLDAISKFDFKGELIHYELNTIGHINETYFLTFKENDGKETRYILQRINIDVFPNAKELMANIENVTKFLRKKVLSRGGDPKRECLELIHTLDEKPYYVDDSHNFYRGYVFIDPSVCYCSIDNKEIFKQAGIAFGSFQNDLADYPSSTLFETIPDFHNTHKRMEAFLSILNKDKVNRASSCKDTIKGYLDNKKYAEIFFKLDKTKYPLRVTHNDTKLNNVLFDGDGKHAICVIDLDTVMPGYAMNDFGDAIRFGANYAGEDEKDLSKVGLNLEYFKSFAEGFLSKCGSSLTKDEISYLPYGAMIMTYECGLRFLSDYLDGDNYFRIEYENHNLVRAKDQLALFMDMKKKKTEMDKIIADLVK